MSWSVQTYRLVSTRSEPGLFCAENELTLGGVPLLVTTTRGLEPCSPSDIQQLFDEAYGAGSGVDAASRQSCFQSIARALTAGDLSYATMLSLMLRLPDIEPSGMSRLARATGTVAAKYDDEEARDWQGRWTSGGGQNSQAASERTQSAASSNAGGAQGSVTNLTGRWPDIHRENPNVVSVQAIPFPLFPPSTVGGVVAGSPKPKDDDIIYPVPIPQTGAGQAAKDSATTEAQAANDNRTRTCPDPSFEPDSKDRTPGQLLYQAQISGLPLGMGVKLNGVKFDGCRLSDGTMLEAKTTTPWLFKMPDFVFRLTQGYSETINQAFRQISAAGSRKIEWHFTDPRVAEFWNNEFHRIGYNISASYTPFIPTVIKALSLR